MTLPDASPASSTPPPRRPLDPEAQITHYVLGDATPPTPPPLLPKGIEPLQHASLRAQVDDVYCSLRDAIAAGTVSDADLVSLLKAIPRDRMRKLVFEYAGMGSTLLMTLSKNVQLVDTVLSRLVTPDGELTSPDTWQISLKDAMNISLRCTQMIMRDLPKVYSVERIQRLEVAIGEVMEKYLTPEQQGEVLKRLETLSGEQK